MPLPTLSAPTATSAYPALRLAALLDLTAANALHRQLQDVAEHGGPLCIEGEDVERVSTPCLQLLVAAAIGARAHGQAFQMIAPSAVLANAIADLGLAHVLGMED